MRALGVASGLESGIEAGVWQAPTTETKTAIVNELRMVLNVGFKECCFDCNF